jgi:23S rRNA (adenine2503-C2)-methyltransferase
MATLYCKSSEELIEYLSLDKAFQAKIVYQNLIKGITKFEDMTSLPKALRERLSSKHVDAMSSKVIRKSEAESATKLAVELEDGKIVECVRLSDGQGRYYRFLPGQRLQGWRPRHNGC